MLAGDHREQPARGGIEESGSGAEEQLRRVHLRDRGVAADQQHTNRRLTSKTRDVGAHHHRLAADTVGDDPADQQRADQRHNPCSQHDPEVGRRPSQIENRECQGNGHDAIADQRRNGSSEHEPEVAQPEYFELPRQTHQRILAGPRRSETQRAGKGH